MEPIIPSSPAADPSTLRQHVVKDEEVFVIATHAEQKGRSYGRASSPGISKWRGALRDWCTSHDVLLDGLPKDATDQQPPKDQVEAVTVTGHPDRSWLLKIISHAATALSFWQTKRPRKGKGGDHPGLSFSSPTSPARLAGPSTVAPPPTIASVNIASSPIPSVSLGLEVLVDAGGETKSPTSPSSVTRARYKRNDTPAEQSLAGSVPPSFCPASSCVGVDDPSVYIEEVRSKTWETIRDCITIMTVHERNGGPSALPELPYANPNGTFLHGNFALSQNGLLIGFLPSSRSVGSPPDAFPPANPDAFPHSAPAAFPLVAPAALPHTAPVAFPHAAIPSSVALPPALVGPSQIATGFRQGATAAQVLMTPNAAVVQPAATPLTQMTAGMAHQLGAIQQFMPARMTVAAHRFGFPLGCDLDS